MAPVERSSAGLHRKRLLVVEDEYLVAEDMRHELEELGASVLGPVASVAAALAVLSDTEDVDGAILDVNLCGEVVYPVAGVLHERQVPFVFWTGYGSLGVPETYRDVPHLQKAGPASAVVQALLRRLDARSGAAPTGPVMADVYIGDDGSHLLALRQGPHPIEGADLAWVGATLLNAGEWGRRLKVDLRAGVLYRVPWRYAASLRGQLAVMG